MKQHFSSFEVLSTRYVEDTVAKKHGVWEFRHYLYVIVFLLNCKISDILLLVILLVIDGAQVGYALKVINAGRNSSRDRRPKWK